jgi:serine/threonine protein kinase
MASHHSSSSSSSRRVGKYELGRTLGQGTFGKVKSAVDTSSNQPVAIKMMDKAKIRASNMGEQIKKEIAVMKLVKHPSVIQLIEVLASPTTIYLVIELVTGGELFDKILEEGRMDESVARTYFRQLIEGIEHCHMRNVVHRDLKPENLLLTADNPPSLKISDFGLSALTIASNNNTNNLPNEIQLQQMLHTTCGTPNYCIAEDTLVNLTNGSCVSIQHLEQHINTSIFAYSEGDNGLIVAQSNELYHQGLQECIELIFEDGRSLLCTPSHMILTDKHQWVAAEKLALDDDNCRVLVGLSQAIDNHQSAPAEQLLELSYSYSGFNFNTFANRQRIKALFRLAGSVAHLNDNAIHFAHSVDLNSFLDDFKSVFLTSPLRTAHALIIPHHLLTLLYNLYKQLECDNLPSILIAEYLAAAFGFNATLSEQLHSISYSPHKCRHISLKLLATLMLRFDIDSDVDDSGCLVIDELSLYSQSIGFRYNIYNQQQLTLAQSYRSKINAINAEKSALIRSAQSLSLGSNLLHSEAINLAVANFPQLLYPKHSIPTVEEVNSLVHAAVLPPISLQQFIRSVSAQSFHSNIASDKASPSSLPFFQLKLLSRRSVGKRLTYDLHVPTHHSFQANGIIVHNCAPEILIDASDKGYDGKAADICNAKLPSFCKNLLLPEY